MARKLAPEHTCTYITKRKKNTGFNGLDLSVTLSIITHEYLMMSNILQYAQRKSQHKAIGKHTLHAIAREFGY